MKCRKRRENVAAADERCFVCNSALLFLGVCLCCSTLLVVLLITIDNFQFEDLIWIPEDYFEEENKTDIFQSAGTDFYPPSNRSEAATFGSKIYKPPLEGPATAENASIHIEITKAGLEYANEVAGRILNDLISDVEIPDFDILSNIRFDRNRFEAPNFKFELVEPSRVIWTSSGGRIVVIGRAAYRLSLLGVSKTLKADLELTLEDVRIRIGGDFIRSPTGGPRMARIQSDVEFSNVRLKVDSSKVIEILAKLAKSKAEDFIEDRMKRYIRHQGKRFLEQFFNEKLDGYPTQILLDNGLFAIDTSLASAPKVRQDGLEIGIRGVVSSNDSDFHVPFNQTEIQRSTLGKKMVYFRASDFVLNSFFYSAFEKGRLSFRISKEFQPGVAPFLRTACPGHFCVGSLFPEVSSLVPFCQTGELIINASQPPYIFLSPDQARLFAFVDIHFHISKPEQKLFTVAVELEAEVGVKMEEERVRGRVEFRERRVELRESSVAGMRVERMRVILDMALTLLEAWIDDQFSSGIPIPLTPGIRLGNPSVVFLRRTIQIATDVQYRPEFYATGDSIGTDKNNEKCV